MISAKYLSVFLKTYVPNIISTSVPQREIFMSSQFIGAVPSMAALAL